MINSSSIRVISTGKGRMGAGHRGLNTAQIVVDRSVTKHVSFKTVNKDGDNIYVDALGTDYNLGNRGGPHKKS